MRDPPIHEEIDPPSMSDSELERLHLLLADWLEQAHSSAAADMPDDEVYDAVHSRLSEISRERAERQRDDRQGPTPRAVS